MGRVLAHELYHVVADTAEHGKDGVGQRTLSARELTTGQLEFRHSDVETVFATPEGMDATIFCDFASTRCTDPSLQIGTQTLPKAMANPEQGVFATAITVSTLFVDASRREILFFGLLEIQTLSPIATQSGDPGMGNFAIACSSDIGC